MTARETALLGDMRNELRDYHMDVQRFSVRLEECTKDVAVMSLDLHGNPEDRDNNPGALHHLSTLRSSRVRVLKYLAGAWGIIVSLILLGAGIVAKRLFD